MYKMFSIIIPNVFSLNANQIKAFNERISYLNSSIISCKFDKNTIKIFLDRETKDKEKINLLNSCKKLINRIKLINTISDEKIIFENKVKIINKRNTFQYLKKIKSIKKISPGIFTIRGIFLNYFNKLDIILINRSKKKKYEKIHAHSMLPLESFIQNGYLINFPHHIMLASHIKRDLKLIDRASALDDLKKISKSLDRPNLVISPTVCYHIFETLKDSKLKFDSVFDSISSCNRFESINYSTFERLQSFTMREFVGFGSPKFVKNFLHENIEYFKKVFVRNKIKFKIVTANDAFFSQKGIKKMSFQSINDLKFEFQFWLPNEKKWLAVGSFNNHLDVLVKKYKIQSKQKILHSGCLGWGYERLVYAVISQGKSLNK